MTKAELIERFQKLADQYKNRPEDDWDRPTGNEINQLLNRVTGDLTNRVPSELQGDYVRMTTLLDHFVQQTTQFLNSCKALGYEIVDHPFDENRVLALHPERPAMEFLYPKSYLKEKSQ